MNIYFDTEVIFCMLHETLIQNNSEQDIRGMRQKDQAMNPHSEGGPLPLTPIQYDDLPQPIADLLRSKVERLGYLGDFFKYTAHAPAPLEAFIRFTDAAQIKVPKALTEVVALTIATSSGNDYERHQHERLSVAMGFTPEWVAAVEQLDPDTVPLMNDAERLVQHLALDALRNQGRQAQEHMAAAGHMFAAPVLVSILFLIGRYTAHAAIANLLDLKAPVASIFPAGEKS